MSFRYYGGYQHALINANTKLFGSFSSNPGNLGCEFFNQLFSNLHIDAIYKSFKVTNISDAMHAMKTLGIIGCGISRPFKIDVLNYVDHQSNEVIEIGSANTVINDKGILTAYNTDYQAVVDYLNENICEIAQKYDGRIHVLGSGGYARAVLYAIGLLKIRSNTITRDNWIDIQQIRNSVIFNCTPLDKEQVQPEDSNWYIDCLPHTESGKDLSRRQAHYQSILYLQSLTDASP